MALGDLETALPAKLTKTVADYTSAWWDMRHAAQMMYSRRLLDDQASNYFVRRGLLDGAVVTYCRCFGTGKRPSVKALVEKLSTKQRGIHDAARDWRDHHVAHRVDQKLETVDVSMLWGNFGALDPMLRVRLAADVVPDHRGFENGFEKLAERLANRIWAELLRPAQDALLAELGAAKIAELKAQACPIAEPKRPDGVMGVTLNVGIDPMK